MEEDGGEEEDGEAEQEKHNEDWMGGVVGVRCVW
jgi:hypothetical protein